MRTRINKVLEKIIGFLAAPLIKRTIEDIERDRVRWNRHE